MQRVLRLWTLASAVVLASAADTEATVIECPAKSTPLAAEGTHAIYKLPEGWSVSFAYSFDLYDAILSHSTEAPSIDTLICRYAAQSGRPPVPPSSLASPPPQVRPRMPPTPDLWVQMTRSVGHNTCTVKADKRGFDCK